MSNLELEYAKQAAALSKDIAGDIARPSSQSIGKNLGLAVDGVMGWLGCWGEKQKIKQAKHIEEFKKNLSSKITNIPQDRLVEPSISIVGPIIEASKYYYEEIHYREMFSDLLAAACDSAFTHKIHPSFVEILKQLAPLDAKFLNMFKYDNTYPMCDIQEIHEDSKITPFNQSLFDFKGKQSEFLPTEHIFLTASLDNLMRLGIMLKNRSIIELNYNYETFKDNFMYKEYDKVKDNSKNTLKIIPARIELTNFGRSFVSCCFQNNSTAN